MVFPLDPSALPSLPMRGGALAVQFDSPEDARIQKEQYLTLQSLFIESETFPKPFSEPTLAAHFPDGNVSPALPVRVVQLVEHGMQKGFLVQFLTGFQPLSELIEKLMQSPSEPAPEAEPDPEPEPASPTPRAAETKNVGDGKPVNRMTLHDKLRKMNINERARLAARADKLTRSVLLRDVEPQVIMFMLKNPHITRGEIVEITKSPRINYNIAKIILANRSWAQSEEIRYNLVMNPKTPLPEALKLIPGLNMKHLREIAKNQGIKNRIKQTALRLVLERTS